MKFRANLILGMLSLQLLGGCVSLNSKQTENRKAPELTVETALDDLIEAGLNFGDKTLLKAKKLIDKRGQRKEWVVG